MSEVDNGPSIIVASKHSSLDDLRRKASETVKPSYASKKEDSQKDISKELKQIVGAGVVAGATALGEEIGEGIRDRIKSKATVEKEFGESAFMGINERILDDKTGDDEREELIKKRRKMYKAADESGVFDGVRARIISIIKDSDWNHVRDNLENYADRAESEASGLRGFNKDWEGIVKASVLGTSLKVASDGYKQIENDDGALTRNGMTRDALKRLYIRTEREHFMPLGFNPHDYVGNNLRKERESYVQSTQKSLDEIKDGFAQIIGDYTDKRDITTNQMFVLYQKQMEELTEAMKGVDPEQERENWIDLEYRQEFWQRFEPRSWPKFYEKATGTERLLWDIRWQLARAAFLKKVTSAFPDKYRENQDLAALGKEQMEALYNNVEGVKVLLGGYVKAAVEGEKVTTKSGKEISIWEVADMEQFDEYREALRLKYLEPLGITGLKAKEADAVAWNLIWVSNLLESVDSRYSYTGASHGNLPGNILAGEYKYVLHPQERFEGKCLSRHFWGAFGKWGVTQMDRIRKECGFDNKKGDEILFTSAPKGKYWTWEKTSLVPSNEVNRRKETGKVYQVFVPECYPAISAKSFWEETKVERQNSNGEWEKVSLLEYLLDGKEIPWNEVAQDAWVIYMTGKFHKAYSLQEYFMGGKEKMIEVDKFGWGIEWALPLIELFNRLGINDVSKKLVEEGKSYQSFSMLKSWIVCACTGGVKNPLSVSPSFTLSFMDKGAVQGTLKHNRIKYFAGGEKLKV